MRGLWAFPHRGFPIRKSSAGSACLAADRSLSQLATSFIGMQSRGIHVMRMSNISFLIDAKPTLIKKRACPAKSAKADNVGSEITLFICHSPQTPKGKWSLPPEAPKRKGGWQAVCRHYAKLLRETHRFRWNIFRL